MVDFFIACRREGMDDRVEGCYESFAFNYLYPFALLW